MLARELGFLQGFRLSGRDPEAQSATPDALPHSQPRDGLSGLRPRTVAPLLQRSWASSRIDWDRGSAAKVVTSRDAHDAGRFACQAGCSRCARRLPWTTAG